MGSAEMPRPAARRLREDEPAVPKVPAQRAVQQGALYAAGHGQRGVRPRVPARQWTLSLPYALHFRLAWDHRLTSRVLGVAMRAILGFCQRYRRDW